MPSSRQFASFSSVVLLFACGTPPAGTDSGSSSGATGEPSSGEVTSTSSTSSGSTSGEPTGSGGQTMGESTTSTSATSTSSGPGSSGSSTGEVCADADVTFEPKTPTIYLLLDQSGSMTAAFNGVTRWQAVYDALLAPGQGLVEQFQAEVRFGMGLYTAQDADPVCPQITEVAPDLNNYGAMEAVFIMNQPVEDTPTGDSIVAVLPTVLADPAEGTKAIVLATDGEPDTCAVLDPQMGQPEAVAAATMAYDQGVLVYIISVGDEVSDAHLQDMANAGAGVQMGDPNAPFWKANDNAGLVAAFQQIIEGVRSCKLGLNGSVEEGKADQCSVLVNGAPVPFGDPDGWQLNDPSEVELVGAACDAIQEGAASVKITCPCGVVIPG